MPDDYHDKALTYLVSVAGYSVGGAERRSSAGFGVVIRRGGRGQEWRMHVCHATDYQARRVGERFILDQLRHRQECRQSGPNYGKKYPYVLLTAGTDHQRALALAKMAATYPIQPTCQEI